MHDASAITALAARPIDRYLVWIVMVLSAVGIVAVYSAVSFLADTKADGATELFLFRHVIRTGLAIGAMLLFMLVDYHRLAKISMLALLVSLALLVAVQLSGVVSGGAARWLRVGSFGFQPSDLAKIALMLHIAVLLCRKQAYIKSWNRAFVPIFFWILVTAALIGMEDLSTSVIVVATALVMCFVGRVNVMHLAGLLLVGLMLASALLMTSPSRAARVETFVGVKIFPHTEAEAVFSTQNEGYQAQQSKIAFAMGGLTGVGPGKSTQRDFLPAPYNDFIFAIIAEEYGVIGAVALLALFLIFLMRGFLMIARHAPDPLGLLLGVGLTTMVVLYGFIHAGVASGLLPVTGLPMPFVSYGGTSLLATGIIVGILLNISAQSNDPQTT